jgi:lysozyme family protein
MATFKTAFNKVIINEGGYGNDPQDSGGETYKGVARNMNRNWEGWEIVDALKKQPGFPASLDRSIDLQMKVEDLYKTKYWNPVGGDELTDELVAFSIFDFAVNAGVATSVRLAQMVADVKADGDIGPVSIAAINKMDEEHFLAAFTVAKIMRYYKICENKPVNRKFFYGWVRRALHIH